MSLSVDSGQSAVFQLESTAGDGEMNVRVLIKLSAVRTQSQKIPTSTPSLRTKRSMTQVAARKRVLSRDQLLLKKSQSKCGMVKVISCQSQSCRMWICCDTHCSVALKPQALQDFDLQLWQKKREWVHPGDEK